MKGLSAAWITYLAIATYQWEKAHRGTLPPPGIYLGSTIVFGGLGVVGTAAPGFAATFAWALIVAAGVSGSYSQIADVPTPAQINSAKAISKLQREQAAGVNPPQNVGPPSTLKGLLGIPTTGSTKQGRLLGGKPKAPVLAPSQ